MKIASEIYASRLIDAMDDRYKWLLFWFGIIAGSLFFPMSVTIAFSGEK
jgi:hypothetical protein